MKKLIIVLSLLALTGCSTLNDVLFIAQYDDNEYMLVNKVRTQASTAKKLCGKQLVAPFSVTDHVYVLYDTTLELRNYSQYIPKNQQTQKPVSMLFDMVVDLKLRYEKNTTVSKAYCELKLNSIELAAEDIQKAIGKRPR